MSIASKTPSQDDMQRMDIKLKKVHGAQVAEARGRFFAHFSRKLAEAVAMLGAGRGRAWRRERHHSKVCGPEKFYTHRGPRSQTNLGRENCSQNPAIEQKLQISLHNRLTILLNQTLQLPLLPLLRRLLKMRSDHVAGDPKRMGVTKASNFNVNHS